jgi:hypothetical protein
MSRPSKKKAKAKGGTCPTCGAPTELDAATCRYCTSPLAWEGAAPMTPTRTVDDAASRWAKGVFGAPRGFGALITDVQVRDEVIERVFTRVARRDVYEQRAPWADSVEHRANLDVRAVDPFAIGLDALKTQSLHVATCSQCVGTGWSACGTCNGSARVNCGNCSGSGQELRVYKKSSRWIKCTGCRGRGTMTCGMCSAGKVSCDACLGRGRQLAWLTYQERTRAILSLRPSDSPVIVGHRQLAAERPLQPEDLEAFGVMLVTDADGPLASTGNGAEAEYSRALLASLDSRLERVIYEQYVRIAVVRRDAAFEMCGMRSTLVLSGSDLTGASTDAAVRPIKTRLVLWAAIAVIVFLVGMSLKGRLLGRAAYFERANGWISPSIVLATLLVVLIVGAVLRELKPRLRLGRLRRYETYMSGGAAALILFGISVSVFSRPKLEEVQRALASGNVAAARRVADALKDTLGGTREVKEADDLVAMTEAKTAPLTQSLELLDGVARGGGTKAVDARRAARVRRLSEIAQHIERKAWEAAVGLVDHWYRDDWKRDAEVAELRARAQELQLAECASGACRLTTARSVAAASPSIARTARVAEIKGQLLSSLVFVEQSADPPLARLQRLRSLGAGGTDVLRAAGKDVELIEAATKAVDLAAAQRAKVPVIGASEPVVAELLSKPTQQSEKVSVAALEGVAVYVLFDKQRSCRGLYAVGPGEGSRAITSTTWSGERILSQALGRTAALRGPAQTSGTVSRWAEAGVPVVARWRAGSLVELRIGDAAP